MWCLEKCARTGVCVCVYVCTGVYGHVCIYRCMCVHVCVCVYLGILGTDCGSRIPSFPSWQPVRVCKEGNDRRGREGQVREGKKRRLEWCNK